MNERIIARGLDLTPLWKQMRQRFRFEDLHFELYSPDDPTGPKHRRAFLLLNPAPIADRVGDVVGPENLSIEYHCPVPDLYSCRLTILGGVRTAFMEAADYNWGCKAALHLAACQFAIGTRVFNHRVDVRVNADDKITNREEVRQTLIRRMVIAE